MSSVWRSSFPDAITNRQVWREIATRILLITAFIITEDVNPFWRIIQPEEIWLYKYPNTTGYVTTLMLYIIVVTLCIGIVLVFFIINRSYREAYEGLLVPSLALPLNGLITNLIKISVGRPRPDYYARCLPGVVNIDVNLPCTGDMEEVNEGRKSFPSGHSSMSFCAFGFLSLYIAGKLGVFNKKGRGKSWRMLVSMTPLVCSILIAASRTSDYHHHWQDVTVGGIIGLLVIILVYHQHYPPLNSYQSDLPYVMISNEDKITNNYARLDQPVKLV